ncbi:MAG TPA: hypothetical protein DCE41_31065 [Cytophagales bacterium]|nr:hypothetical protein [Cytophagales bacterium]HAP65080.1 hypothetical protein [Cytophagales bacterium]
MRDEDIKQILKENLLQPDKEKFNEQILSRVEVEVTSKKPRPTLFSEKSMVQWFLFVAALVLGFEVFYDETLDSQAVVVIALMCTVPLFLLLFNRIFALKFKGQ